MAEKQRIQALASRDRRLFDGIAKKYARKDLASVSSIPRRNVLLQLARPLLRAQGTLGRVIEVGCGAGFPARYLAGHYTAYTGIDHSGELIALARQFHGGLSNVSFFQSDVNDPYLLTTLSGAADTVLAVGVLHHMQDVSAALQHMRHLAKPGAAFVAIEPNRRNKVISILRAIRKKIDASYSKDQVFFLPQEVETFLRDAGMKNIAINYAGFFSTPFAEIIFKPPFVWLPVSCMATYCDNIIKACAPVAVRRYSWSMLISATFPGHDTNSA